MDEVVASVVAGTFYYSRYVDHPQSEHNLVSQHYIGRVEQRLPNGPIKTELLRGRRHCRKCPCNRVCCSVNYRCVLRPVSISMCWCQELSRLHEKNI
jgi:hypothetical protein